MFGRKGAGGTPSETLLIIEQHAFQYRSPDWFGDGAYYVRVFRPPSGDRPTVIIADTGNDPVASVTNRFDEIAVIASDRILGVPGVAAGDLTVLARWLDNWPAGTFGPSGETYNEVWFEGGKDATFPELRHRYLRHPEVEKLIGARVRPLQAKDCTRERLRRRGVREIRVTGQA
jgi:hypothetical protein